MTGQVAIRMFGDEIEKLGQEYPEIKGMFDEKSGKLNIPKSKFGSTLYDYEIVSGSTFAADKEKQNQSLISLFGLISNSMQVNPQTGEASSPLIEQLKKENKVFMFGEALTRIISASGIQDWDKIIVDNKYDIEAKMQANMQKFTQLAQQMQAQNVNQVPPTPPAQPDMAGLPQQKQAPPQMPQTMGQPGQPPFQPNGMQMNG